MYIWSMNYSDVRVKLKRARKSTCPGAERELKSTAVENVFRVLGLSTSGYASFCLVHPTAMEPASNMF